jgi:hypothetical protein
MPTADSFASKEVVTAALIAVGIDLKEVRVVGDDRLSPLPS